MTWALTGQFITDGRIETTIIAFAIVLVVVLLRLLPRKLTIVLKDKTEQKKDEEEKD